MTQTPYPESSEHDEDDKGCNSNFQLPPYILKNLTPLKKKSGAKHEQTHMRRDQQLESKINRLKERSVTIETKLQNLRLQRTLLMNDRIRNVRNSHMSAVSRRNAYLELVRSRAKRFTSRRDSETTWPIPEPKQVVIVPASPKQSNEEDVLDCLHKLRESRYLDKLEAASFREVRILTVSAYNANIQTILSHLLGHHPSWSHFFYAYMMLADFRDSIRKSFKHPGFNTNVENVKENFFNNFIWVLLYKCSHRLISELRAVVATSDLNSDSFMTAWDDYYFIFQIFKQIHFNNLSKILVQAISIVETQMELVDDDLQPQLKRLQCEKALLWTYNRPPVQDQRTATFIEHLEYRVNEIFEPQTNKLPKLWDRNVINCGRTFGYDNVIFRIPTLNYVLSVRWREYWFGKFRNSQQRDAPEVMQTGHFKTTTNQPLYDVTDFLKFMEFDTIQPYASLYEQNEMEQRKNLSSFLSKLTDNVVEYTEAKSSRRIFDSRSLGFIVSCLNHETNQERWLFLLTDYFVELETLLAGDLAAKFAQNCLQGIYLNNEQSQIMLLENLQELEMAMANWWLLKCGFVDHDTFRQFENVYVYINAKNFSNLRPAIFTNSPSLIFPKLYASLTGFALKNYLNMVEGSYSKPQIFDSSPNRQAFTFFNEHFTNIIIKGNIYPNELNQLYINDLKRLHYKLKNVVEANTCVLLLKNYYPYLNCQTLFTRMYAMWNHIDEELDFAQNIDDELISLTIEERLLKYLAMPEILRFIKYYFRSRRQISSITVNKVAHLMTMDHTHFDEYACALFGSITHIKPLMLEITSLTTYIYQLYQPLLNWIYIDLGKPELTI